MNPVVNSDLVRMWQLAEATALLKASVGTHLTADQVRVLRISMKAESDMLLKNILSFADQKLAEEARAAPGAEEANAPLRG